jgi:hypothetical protein
VVLLLLAAALSGRNSSARALNAKSEDLFVGWQGESYKPAAGSEVRILRGCPQHCCIQASCCYPPISARQLRFCRFSLETLTIPDVTIVLVNLGTAHAVHNLQGQQVDGQTVKKKW